MAKNYVNNKTLFEVMSKYCGEYHHNKLNGIEAPRIPNYIGEALYLIATRLANKPNFSGYTYKDEMIGDGIENCLMYLHNFNPERTNNPFAYFTQIIKFAFIRRIEKERKQQYIRIKSLSSVEAELENNGENHIKRLPSNDSHDEFIRSYEKKLSDKKKPAIVPLNNVSEFFNEGSK
jgi:hypothetical protein